MNAKAKEAYKENQKTKRAGRKIKKKEGKQWKVKEKGKVIIMAGMIWQDFISLQNGNAPTGIGSGNATVPDIAVRNPMQEERPPLRRNETPDARRYADDTGRERGIIRDEYENRGFMSVPERDSEDAKKIRELADQVEILSSKLKKSQFEARHDMFTRLRNEAAFREDMMKMEKYAGSGIYRLVAFSVDLRYINEQIGRQKGDEVLLYVAQKLGDKFEFSYRMGGEKFNVITATEWSGKKLDFFCSQIIAAFKEAPIEMYYGMVCSDEDRNGKSMTEVAVSRMFENKKYKDFKNYGKSPEEKRSEYERKATESEMSQLLAGAMKEDEKEALLHSILEKDKLLKELDKKNSEIEQKQKEILSKEEEFKRHEAELKEALLKKAELLHNLEDKQAEIEQKQKEIEEQEKYIDESETPFGISSEEYTEFAKKQHELHYRQEEVDQKMQELRNLEKIYDLKKKEVEKVDGILKEKHEKINEIEEEQKRREKAMEEVGDISLFKMDEEIKQKEEELKKRQESLAGKENAIKFKEESIIRRENALVDMEKEIIAKEENFHQRENVIIQKEEDLAKRENGLSGRENVIENMTRVLAKKEMSLKEQREVIEKQQESIDEKCRVIDAKNEELSRSEEELKNREAEIEKQKQSLAGMEEDIINRKNDISRMEAQIADSKKIIEELKAKAAEESREEIKKNTEELERLKNSVSGLEEAIRQKKESAKVLENEAEEKRKSLKALDEDIDKKRAAAEDISASLEEKKKKKEEIDKILSDKQKAIDEAKNLDQTMNEKQSQIREADSKIAERDRLLNEKTEEIRQKEEQIRKLTELFEEKKTQYTQKVQEKQNEAQKLEQNISAKQEAYDNLQRAMAVKETAFKELEEELLKQQEMIKKQQDMIRGSIEDAGDGMELIPGTVAESDSIAETLSTKYLSTMWFCKEHIMCQIGKDTPTDLTFYIFPTKYMRPPVTMPCVVAVQCGHDADYKLFTGTNVQVFVNGAEFFVNCRFNRDGQFCVAVILPEEGVKVFEQKRELQTGKYTPVHFGKIVIDSDDIYEIFPMHKNINGQCNSVVRKKKADDEEWEYFVSEGYIKTPKRSVSLILSDDRFDVVNE